MADISAQIAAIMSAVYGEQVRGSIRDALNAMNSEVDAKNEVPFGICTTEGSTNTKEVTISGFDYTKDQLFGVVFKNTQTTDLVQVALRITDGNGIIRYLTIRTPGGDSLSDRERIIADSFWLFYHQANTNLAYVTGYRQRKALTELVVDGTVVNVNANDQITVHSNPGIKFHTSLASIGFVNIGLNLAAGEGVSITENQQTGQLTISADVDVAKNLAIGVCTTASGTATKDITIPEFDYTKDQILAIMFRNGNTADASDIRLQITNANNEVVTLTPRRRGNASLLSRSIISSYSSIAFYRPANSSYAYVIENITPYISSISINGNTPIRPLQGFDYISLLTGTGIKFSQGSNTNAIVADLNVKAGNGISLSTDLSDKSVTIAAEPRFNAIFTPDELECEIFDNYWLKRSYVTSSSGSEYSPDLEAKSGFVTVLIKNVKRYGISKYSFNLDYGETTVGSNVAVAGISANALSGTGIYTGVSFIGKYKAAVTGVNTYSAEGLDEDPTAQPIALLVSFYKNDVAAADIVIDGTLELDLKKYTMSKLNDISAKISLLEHDPIVDEIIEGGSENG